MGWFKRSVQPQPEDVVQIVANPLFGQSAAPAAAQGAPAAAQAPQQLQQRPMQAFAAEQLGSPDADAQPLNDPSAPWGAQQPWQQHSLRAPAGLHADTEGAHAAAGQAGSSTASGRASAGGMRDHAPAPLLLPADEPPASASTGSEQQGFVDEGCYTPGTVHGADSPPGPLHVPAGLSKAPAHAAASTPKPAHRLASTTPSTAAAAAAAGLLGHAKAQTGQSAAASWQAAGQGSGSSSGNWGEGAAGSAGTGPCSPAGVCLHAPGSQLGSPAAATLPGTPTSRGIGSHSRQLPQNQQQPGQQQRTVSRPTSAIKRQVQHQLQLQQQQQQQQQQAARSHHDEVTDGSEDELLAELFASLDTLQAAAQLARTESGMAADRLPATLAAIRASVDGSATSSGSSSHRTSTSSYGSISSRQGSGAGFAGAVVLRSTSNTSGISTATGSGAQDTVSCNASAGSSLGGERLLGRGRSRLQATISNAALASMMEEGFEDDSDSSDEREGDGDGDGSGSLVGSPAGLAQHHAGNGSQHAGSGDSPPSRGLVLLKVGTGGEAVPLTAVSKAATPHNGRGSSGSSSSRNSRSSGSSSKEGSVHDGTASPAAGVVPASGAAAGARALQQESSQEQQRQQQQQKALLLQQEQQRMQERRQQKQEQVVSSYSCLSPHSPVRASRQSFSTGEGCGGRSSNSASSRPSSSTDAPAAQQLPAQGLVSGASGGGGTWATPAAGRGSGFAAGLPAAAAAAPGSLADAWAAIQAGSPKVAPAGIRPVSAAVPAVVMGAGGGSLVLHKVGSGLTPPHGGLRAAASVASTLLAPLPPGAGRVLSAGAAPSRRAKSAATAAVAAAGRQHMV